MGSVTDLTDSSGTLLESYSYDVFGNPDTTSDLGNTRMFTARELDSETGLYYYRARYYDPKLGRFLQRDPVGYTAGINLYTYCDNNPINWVDALGLEKQKEEVPGWIWGALIAATLEPTAVGEAAVYPIAAKYLIRAGIITIAAHQASRNIRAEMGYVNNKILRAEGARMGLGQNPLNPDPKGFWQKVIYTISQIARLLAKYHLPH